MLQYLIEQESGLHFWDRKFLKVQDSSTKLTLGMTLFQLWAAIDDFTLILWPCIDDLILFSWTNLRMSQHYRIDKLLALNPTIDNLKF